MTSQSTQLALRDDMPLSDLGRILAQSGFFADAKDAGQAIVKVLAGRELGFGPIASMTGVYIVKGRVSLSANLLAAAIKRSGRYDYRVITNTAQAVEIVFYEVFGGKREEIGRSSFTAEDAKKAGLGGDNWNKYPRNMLFARAISNGAKWYCPDVFGGPVYTPDELGAIVDGETGEVIDAPMVDITPAPAPAPSPAAPAPAAKTNGQRRPLNTQADDEAPNENAWDKYNGLLARAAAEDIDVSDLDTSRLPRITVGELRHAYVNIRERIIDAAESMDADAPTAYSQE